jgi:hypothetical protein
MEIPLVTVEDLRELLELKKKKHEESSRVIAELRKEIETLEDKS